MFDIASWTTAVITDPTVSPNQKTRARWAAGIAGLAVDGVLTASLKDIGRAIGYSPRSSSAINVVHRLEAGGRLHRISRGYGAINGSPSVPSIYRLIAAEPAEPAAGAVLRFPTDRAALLRLARDVGDALLAA